MRTFICCALAVFRAFDFREPGMGRLVPAFAQLKLAGRTPRRRDASADVIRRGRIRLH